MRLAKLCAVTAIVQGLLAAVGSLCGAGDATFYHGMAYAAVDALSAAALALAFGDRR